MRNERDGFRSESGEEKPCTSSWLSPKLCKQGKELSHLLLIKFIHLFLFKNGHTLHLPVQHVWCFQPILSCWAVHTESRGTEALNCRSSSLKNKEWMVCVHLSYSSSPFGGKKIKYCLKDKPSKSSSCRRSADRLRNIFSGMVIWWKCSDSV